MNDKKIRDMINKRARYDQIESSMYLSKYWIDLAAEFNGTEDEIIEFLETLDNEQLEYASEVFDDIHAAFDYSQSFIDKLIKLQEKRPDTHLGLDYFGYKYK